MVESHREEIAKLEALYAGNPGGRVFVHLAEAYRKAGEHERARRILDDGLGRHPDSASGYVVLGRVLADMQVTDEAETAFRRVLELDGGNLVALRWLGDLARQQGHNAQAALRYRELLVRNPSNEEVRDLVEILEREAGAPLASTSGERMDAQDGPSAAAAPEPEPVAGEPPDTEPWNAAPGRTGDAEEARVDFELVELDVDEEVAAETASGNESVEGDFDIVASMGGEDASTNDLDRAEDAQPLEVHLLDPSFEAGEADEEEDDDFAAEIDISDLAAAGSIEDEEDYADAAFIADLTGAVEEESSPDEIAQDAALTLAPAEEPPAADAPDSSADVDQTHAADVGESGAAPWEPTRDQAPGTERMSGAGLAELAGAAGPAAESQPGEVRRESDTGLVTETMAILYRSQGFHDRAADVYRSLLRGRPGDERLAAKLREAEAAAATPAAGAAAPPTQAAGDDEAGEVWLRGVGAAFMAGDDAIGETTPYAWTAEPDEPEATEPIGSYLRDLVAWKAGRGRRPQESAPVDHGSARPAGGGKTQETGSIPDWLTDPGASREWANSAPGGADAEPWAGAVESASAEEPPATNETEPWGEASDSESADQPAVQNPWVTASEAAPESTSAGEPPAADPWAGSTGAGSSGTPAETGSPDEGWTPYDLETDPEPPGSVADADTDRTPAAELEDEAAEDEDLEMFRSWLQSLKK